MSNPTHFTHTNSNNPVQAVGQLDENGNVMVSLKLRNADGYVPHHGYCPQLDNWVARANNQPLTVTRRKH